jgi:hypothetical protein
MVPEIRSKNSSSAVIADIANVSNFDASDYCLYISCGTAAEEGHRYVPNAERNKCVNAKSEAEQKCDIMISVGKAERWGGDTCVCKDTTNAEWNGTYCVCKDSVNAAMGSDGICKCKDNDKEYKGGNCVLKEEDNGGNPGTVKCGTGAKDNGSGACVCKDLQNATMGNDNSCSCNDATNATMDADGICKCNDDNKKYKDGKCVYTDGYKKTLTESIDSIAATLDETARTFESSKWRNADGKFNTARLASDSIAAVVLGTTGGLISSKVIKKKQVEEGFEDIRCTIGSQEVAEWGDEFQVGIQ